MIPDISEFIHVKCSKIWKCSTCIFYFLILYVYMWYLCSFMSVLHVFHSCDEYSINLRGVYCQNTNDFQDNFEISKISEICVPGICKIWKYSKTFLGSKKNISEFCVFNIDNSDINVIFLAYNNCVICIKIVQWGNCHLQLALVRKLSQLPWRFGNFRNHGIWYIVYVRILTLLGNDIFCKEF